MVEKPIARPRMSAAERRATIVEAALKLFGEKGFRGTTTRELAAAVGVTEPVLYEHFKTKSELYTAIIDAKSQEGMARLTELAEEYREKDDDYGFFRTLADIIVAFHQSDPAYVRLLLFSGLEGHELKEVFYERQKKGFFDLVAGYLRRRMDAGTIRRLDPMLATRAFTGMIADYALGRVVFRCDDLERSQEETLDGLVEIFLFGICAPEAR